MHVEGQQRTAQIMSSCQPHWESWDAMGISDREQLQEGGRGDKTGWHWPLWPEPRQKAGTQTTLQQVKKPKEHYHPLGADTTCPT